MGDQLSGGSEVLHKLAADLQSRLQWAVIGARRSAYWGGVISNWLGGCFGAR